MTQRWHLSGRDLDAWSAKLICSDGKVYARWKLGRELPRDLVYDVKHEILVRCLQFLDADEKHIADWYPPHPTWLMPGDQYRFTLSGIG